MPQKTNLNINPYYDDFNKDNNFHRVLFRPGRPVQARELTTLQSILQNQIDTFGSHIFKEGSMVIPGNVEYDNEYFSVKLDSEHLGLPVSLYIDQLKGKKLKGQNSGIEVLVNDYKLPSDSVDITDVTLFIKYLSADDNNSDSKLSDGESLLAQSSITYGNTTIDIGESVANLISSNATFTGCAVYIADGVYFIRGNFVNVSADTLVLDPYSNNPSYRVGLNILESIITAKEDNSLYDNARGFSNYAAPGADRLKITTTLAKKSLTDFNDGSFVELVKLREGELKKLQDSSQYSLIAKYFADRTFEESGNYSLDNFNVNVSESLNDNISNEGIFQSNQITDQGNTPSDDLACVEIESGKAYIKGYRVNRTGTTIVDTDKPRDVETVDKAKIGFEMGTLIRVNNVAGTPLISLDNSNNNIIKLYDLRKDTGTLDGPPPTTLGGSTPATEIGQARVYSFGLRNTPYKADIQGSSSEWDLRLFDLQTYTKLKLNIALDADAAPVSSFIRGVSSGATGYIVSTSTVYINLSQTSGSFIVGEKLLVNETEEYSRTVEDIVVYGSDDIKSVYQDSTSLGLQKDFTADTLLREVPLFNGTIEVLPQGTPMLGKITSPGNTFNGVKLGSIVRYQSGDFSGTGLKVSDAPNFNKVTQISPDLTELTVAGISSVVGVCTGFVGVATGSGISLVVGEIIDNQSEGLYSPIETPNISNLDLSNSELSVTTQITGAGVNSNKLTASVANITGITSSFFTNFDTQKYSVFYADGTIEPLTKDQVTFVNGFTEIEIDGLTKTTATNVTVNVTVEKQVIKEKIKQFSRSNQIVIDKTNSLVSTAVSGLTTSRYYGLRVEDREISLNVPDVYKVLAVLESNDTSNPTLDKLTFVSGLSLDTNAVIGEKIIGSETNAIAQIVNLPSSTEVEVVYLNSNTFAVGELVTFDESNITTSLQVLTLGNNLNITNSYSLDSGNREQYCDYSRIVRRGNLPAPSKKVLIVYDSYKVPTNDTGDLFTVNSYSKDRYSKDIPLLSNNVRASDTLDFRPRVPEFTVTTKSPFAFTSRDFVSGNGTTPTLVVSTEDASEIGYSYYLPRIDKLVLGTGKEFDGKFSLIKGVSSLNPKEPALIDELMHIATIHLPAYLYDVKDAKVTLIDNKRYTMRDIGKLDDRISNLETVTSLSLLELNTKTLQIRDVTGNDRFKSGFFVDDFKDAERMDFDNPDHKVDVDPSQQEMLVPLDRYAFHPELGIAESYDVSTADFSQNLDLIDENVQKTGDLVTLRYSEVESDIKNAFASHMENVNPFTVVVYTCDIKITPQSDNWTRTEIIDGGQRTITGAVDDTFEENIIIGSRLDTHMRSRNVAFDAVGLKAKTRYYPFFDGRSGIDIVPKLIKIKMVSGSFTIGETIKGFGFNSSTIPNITFRAAQPNHKSGPYGTPSGGGCDGFYTSNPYDPTVNISASYTESSTILNVDLASLVEEAQGKYHGRVSSGMKFIGESSGASAVLDYTVEGGNPIKLISDEFGALSGSFFIRDPLITPPPVLRFNNGTKTFKLTSSSTNELTAVGDVDNTSASVTHGEAAYRTNGTVTTVSRTVVTVRAPEPEPEHGDPLAQSFTTDSDGMFLSSVDVYFAEKDDFQPITAEIVTVELGTPTNQVIQGFARIQLDPQQLDSSGTSIIKTSTDASIATNIKFPSPIYLEPNTEYALVLRAGTTNAYKVWCARMSEPTIETKNLDKESQSIIGIQYIGGSLFKSQNGTIWTASQYEDLKFTLYQCSFVNNGTLTLYNPSLEYDNTNFKSVKNSIETFSRKLKVGVSLIEDAQYNASDILDKLTVGRKVSAAAPGTPLVSADAIGFIESVGAPIKNGGLGITSVGFDYGDSANGIPLYSITGNGSGATGNVTVTDGVVTNVAIAATGNGYAVGDVLGITTSNMKKGSGAQISVTNTWGLDTLYLSNVQGESFTTNNYLIYYNDDGTNTTGAAATAITSSSVNGDLYQGNIIKVDQYNHGMVADNNKVIISNIEPDTVPTTLTADLSLTGTTISVASTATFANFEGISTTSGYAKIGNEIIYYNDVGTGTLSVGERSFGDSLQNSHSNGNSISAYQFNNISLTGINTTHDMSTVPTTLNNIKTIDTYYLTALRGSGRTNLPDRSSGKGQLSFTQNSFGGGDGVLSTQNYQYDTFNPSFNVMIPGTETVVNAQLRSVSGTSEGGIEPSFIDQGFESVEFNQHNTLSSPRLLCSRIDETTRLTNLPRNKSVTLNVNFSTTNSILSPVLDLDNGAFRLLRNRLNNPITDYAIDSRSNALSGDPHAACYISQVVNLEKGSTSLKVIVSAYRHISADFRVLYRLLKPDSSEVKESYKLFPGYDNLEDKGVEKIVIDPNLNNGRPDVFVRSSRDNEFLDYEFTVNDEDEFTGFQIKIVISGTNEAYPPRFKDLRAIALA